jgi:hypothetical protein
MLREQAVHPTFISREFLSLKIFIPPLAEQKLAHQFKCNAGQMAASTAE